MEDFKKGSFKKFSSHKGNSEKSFGGLSIHRSICDCRAYAQASLQKSSIHRRASESFYTKKSFCKNSVHIKLQKGLYPSQSFRRVSEVYLSIANFKKGVPCIENFKKFPINRRVKRKSFNEFTLHKEISEVLLPIKELLDVIYPQKSFLKSQIA